MYLTELPEKEKVTLVTLAKATTATTSGLGMVQKELHNQHTRVGSRRGSSRHIGLKTRLRRIGHAGSIPVMAAEWQLVKLDRDLRG